MAEHEHCPKCTEGILHPLWATEDAEGFKCLHCGHSYSQPKEGYEVSEPGGPITKVQSKRGNRGGES